MTAPVMSVIVPAHDEERVIGRMLERLLEGADGRLEIVVVANGCRDSTAATARAAGPGILVVELDEASKIAALNAGDDATTVFPRAYVDADVEVSGGTLLELAAVLAAERPLVASPGLHLDLTGASTAVRLYYRIWQLRTVGRSGHIGSGVYAVNRAGRERFGRFPAIIADDRFVQGRFAEDERMTLPNATFTVRPPRTLAAHLHRGARIAAGNLQLEAAGLTGAAPAPGSSLGALARRVIPRPGLWLPFLVYGWVQWRTRRLASKRLAGHPEIAWARDESSRV